MSNLNNFNGQGNLTEDPKIYNADDDDRRVARFSVAINNGFGDHATTTFMKCVAFGKQAAVIGKFLTKGKQVVVSGTIVPNTYENKDGITRTVNELELDRFGGFFFTGNAPPKSEDEAGEPAVVEAEPEPVAVAAEGGEGKDGLF